MTLTVRQAAERAGVSDALVYGWCAAGELAHLRLGNKGKRGTIRIEEADLAAFLASRRHGGSEPAEAPAATGGTGRSAAATGSARGGDSFAAYHRRIMAEVAAKAAGKAGAKKKPR